MLCVHPLPLCGVHELADVKLGPFPAVLMRPTRPPVLLPGPAGRTTLSVLVCLLVSRGAE